MVHNRNSSSMYGRTSPLFQLGKVSSATCYFPNLQSLVQNCDGILHFELLFVNVLQIANSF